MDPLGVYTSRSVTPVVAPREHLEARFANLSVGPGWYGILDEEPERRNGTITWTNPLGKTKTQPITIPPADQIFVSPTPA